MSPNPEPTDDDLVVAVRAGTRGAADALVRRYARPIHRYCARMRGSEAAPDLVQEVFVKMVRRIHSWDGRASFKSWLFTVARNACVDAQRKARHRKTEPLDETSVASHVSTPERETERKRLRSALSRAVDALPEAQREVFLLREEAGLSFKEIAELMGTSENTSKSRMRYAMQALKSALEQAGWTP